MSPRTRDTAIVAVLVVWQVVERLVSPMADGPVAVNVVCGLVMAGALWWRRTDPARMVAVLVAGGLASALGGSPPSDVTGSLVAIVLAGYAAGRYLDAPRRWWTAGVLAVGVGGIDVIDYEAAGFVFPVLVVGTCAAVGALLRDRATLTRRLAERTHELDALRAAGERDAVLEERRRIARELHDVVAHTVSVMVVQAAGARRQLERDPERARAALRHVRATGEDTLRELERLFGVLHGGDEPGGVDDVPALVERMRAAGLDVTLAVEGPPGTPSAGAGVAVYRVVQEALTNALKHGGGGRTSVLLRRDGGALCVRVANDPAPRGTGAPRLPGGGHGIAGMRERVAAYGGELSAGPRPDGGFVVAARIPLVDEDAEAAA